ncbi:MAG: hypothetical protein ACOCXA_05715, partial [Planctomycetota bacterium]
MSNLMDTCANAILGVLRGFDRLVFQGRLQQLSFAEGAQRFFSERDILFKDAKKWIQQQTQQITADVDAISRDATGSGIIPIPSSRIRKEELVRTHQQRHGITEGIIGAWSCVEECATFQIRPAAGRPVLVPAPSRCKHLYLYLDHPTFGFMSIRLQTWLPFMIQIAINGREWLGRSLAKAGIPHERRHNKIISCGNFNKAQALLDHQVQRTNWGRELRRLAPLIFPNQRMIVGDEMDYSWFCWQSEWATDLIFADMDSLYHNAEGVLLQAMANGTADRVMRYFDRTTNADGLLRQNAAADITSRLLRFADGLRVRHWLGANSVKIYNQFNNLRIETTVNDPRAFKALRPVGAESVTRAMPLRKGIQDLGLRARASNSVNERVLDSLQASSEQRRPLRDIMADSIRGKTIRGRKVRGLQVLGKDLPLIQIVARAEWCLSGLTNADLRAHFKRMPQYRGKTDKQLAGIATRAIRLLRD